MNALGFAVTRRKKNALSPWESRLLFCRSTRNGFLTACPARQVCRVAIIDMLSAFRQVLAHFA
ncbi:MAG: hypothetical protein PHV32_10035 [Eubacteriales bacterium]|nr:hypothetical protein [Eubacteriales bacterium]